jgi:hypothetical protein
MGSSGFSWTLPDHPKLPKGKPVAVVVLDGWGEANPDQYNCIHVAQTPVMDSLKNVCMLSFTPFLLLNSQLQSLWDCVDEFFFFLYLIS